MLIRVDSMINEKKSTNLSFVQRIDLPGKLVTKRKVFDLVIHIVHFSFESLDIMRDYTPNFYCLAR